MFYEISEAFNCILLLTIIHHVCEVESRARHYLSENSGTFTSRPICGGTAFQTRRRRSEPFRILLNSIGNKIGDASIVSRNVINKYVSFLVFLTFYVGCKSAFVNLKNFGFAITRAR